MVVAQRWHVTTEDGAVGHCKIPVPPEREGTSKRDDKILVPPEREGTSKRDDKIPVPPERERGDKQER